MSRDRFMFIILVRPPGAKMWTQHMKKGVTGHSIPYVSYKEEEAGKVAITIATNQRYCARVISIGLPRNADDYLYALMANGDISFVVTEGGEG
jgi:hypothetical protein